MKKLCFVMGLFLGCWLFAGISSFAQCEGDFDCDGDVDGTDLATFAADFGRTDCPPKSTSVPVPPDKYPTHRDTPPYELSRALWVGFCDADATWRYFKDTVYAAGVMDPGNPCDWVVGGDVGYFDGKLSVLPPGTHINNQYNPGTQAWRARMAGNPEPSDIIIKVGNFWIDKYPITARDVGSTFTESTYMDDITYGGGHGYDSLRPYILAFSQRRTGSTGMTWFNAQQMCVNTGKRLPTNAEWQAAAHGTARSTGNLKENGNNWSVIGWQDISRWGAIGMAGNFQEWVADWGSGRFTATNASNPDEYGEDKVYDIPAALTQGLGTQFPAGVLRGGSWQNDSAAGIFYLNHVYAPSSYGHPERGCRCAMGF